MTDNIAQYDFLLARLYDSVIAPDGFQRFVEEFAPMFSLKAAVIFTTHIDNHEMKSMWAYGMADEWVRKYALEFRGEDVLANHISTAPIANFYASNLDLELSNLESTRFHREWLLPQRIAYGAGAIVLREGPWVSWFFFQRRPDQGAFTRDELAQFNRFIPHLQRAIQMRQRFTELKLAQMSWAAGFEVVAMPAMLVDEFGKIAFQNRAAKQLTTEGSYCWLDNGHLRTCSNEATYQLNTEIVTAVRTSRGAWSDLPGVVRIPRPGLGPLTVIVSSIRPETVPYVRGAAILLVYDAEAPRRVINELAQRLFNLTEAEACLAGELCAGSTLDDVARTFGKSVHTVRSQLKSIFSKTGTKRQADLVSLLLSSPAFFMTSLRQA